MKRTWTLSILVVLLLAGCQKAAPMATPQPTATPQPMATPAATATPQPTATPAATATTRPTATPAPTEIPIPVDRSEPASPVDPFAQARRLGRGVNLGNALDAPREGEWGIVLQEEYFSLIAEAGFDTVRVPVRWSTHAMGDPPYTVDETFFQRIDWVLDQATAQGLNVVLDMHNYDELFVNPDKHEDRFVAIWRQIAIRYRHRPDALFLEPLNEPHDQLASVRWNKLLARVVATIREVDGVHTLILTGADWGGITGLGPLQIPEGEENVICSFHFYDPFLFTHQGAEWVGPESHTVGVQWPGPPAEPLTPIPEALAVPWVKKWFEDYNKLPTNSNPAGPDPIQKQLNMAVKLGELLNKPLWLGEFGAYSKADMQSRVNWTTYVREEVESRGISWAYWEFGAGFGIYDRSTRRWNEGLLGALIPAP
jgi:endoglucanase